MTLTTEILLTFLCVILLACLYRLLCRRLLSPEQEGALPVYAVIPAIGDGDGLEQTLRHLRWLNAENLTAFTVIVADGGLTPAGLEVVRASMKKDPSLRFCPAEEDILILKRKDDHGYFSL